MPTVLYRETFDTGPGPWCTGKDREGGSWHRNIYRQQGNPDPAGWSKTGGESGAKGHAFVESPWYFDDNHGELFWLYLAFFLNRTADAGLKGADLRDATIRLTMRGRGFEPRGAKLFWWIQGEQMLYNWCLTSQPIAEALTAREWTQASVRLTPDESRWSQMGLLNGGLARKLRIIQSTSVADGTLEGILNGGHINGGFILGGVDPNDPPHGGLEFDEVVIER